MFFSLSQAKRDEYILGLYPALALLVGYWGDKAIQLWPDKYYRKWLIVPSLIFLGVMALTTLALPVATGIFFKDWFWAAAGVSVITGICAVLLWLAWRRNQARRLLFLPAAFILVFTLYAVHVLIPKMEYYKSPRPFGAEIATRLATGGQWAMYKFYRAAYVYYTDSFCKVLEDENELQAFLDQPTLSLVVMREKQYRHLSDTLKAKTQLIYQQHIGHRAMVLISNRTGPVMKLLIVDDEPDLLDQLVKMLTDQRYDVDTAADGEAALDKLFENPYDLVVLDIMLPKIDGLTVLKEMRAAGIRTPVIMLTAKGAVEDKVKGLDYGADDYLAKPFATAELMARIRTLFRRSGEQLHAVLAVDDITLDTRTREVRRQDRIIELTPKEFSILEFLLYNKNRAVSRFTLAEHVWGDAFDPFTMSNFIDVHLKNSTTQNRRQRRH